jgi:membrane protein required for colicin V production
MSWQDFNWIDFTILGVLGVSTLVSLVRGFVREAISLVIWVAAFWVAYRFSGQFAVSFLSSIESAGIRLVLSFLILFFGVLIVGAIANYAIGSLVYSTGLSGTDRVLGLIFGFGRGILFISVIVLVTSMSMAQKSEAWQGSQLLPQFEGIAEWLKALLPQQIEQLKDLPQQSEIKSQEILQKVQQAIPPILAIPSGQKQSSIVPTWIQGASLQEAKFSYLESLNL